jgi:parallel beta-helix repeat protein
VGIFANSRLNLAIRYCTIRGFQVGIALIDGSDYIVENNLLDQSRFTGIEISGAGGVVRRNTIVNTAGSPAASLAYAISAKGDIIDNVVDSVFGADSVVDFTAVGIYSPTDAGINFGMVIQGNRIRNLTPEPARRSASSRADRGSRCATTRSGRLPQQRASGSPVITPRRMCATTSSGIM